MAFDPAKLGLKKVTGPQPTEGFNPSSLGLKQTSGPQWTPPTPPPAPQPQSFGQMLGGAALGAARGFGNVAENFGIGAGSAIGQAGLGIGQAALGGLGAAASSVGLKSAGQFLKGAAQQAGNIKQAMYVTPFQKQLGSIPGVLGKGTADVAMLGAGSEAVAPVKAALGTAAESATAGAKAIPYLGRAVTTAAKLGARALPEAGVGAAYGLSQGQTAGQAAGTGATLGVFSALGDALTGIAPHIGKALQKADFRLTPSLEVKAAKKADAAAEFMQKNNILGPMESKYRKLTGLVGSFENTLQSNLPKTVAIPKSAIINDITKNVELLKSTEPAQYNKAVNAASAAIDTLKGTEGTSIKGSINMETALNSKRSYGAQAFKSSKLKDPSVSSEGSFAVEQAFQKAINDAMSSVDKSIELPKNLQSFFGGAKNVSVDTFNKMYSKLLSARNFVGIGKERNDAGLIGRMLGLYIGSSLGESIMPGLAGKAAGAIGGEMLSTHLPGIVRTGLEYGIAKMPNLLPGMARIGIAATTGQSTHPQNQ